MKANETLLHLLHIVIDNYISKWEPIGSKFLATMKEADIDYAPSTLRKYLQQLEQSGLVYQPYNSSWRIPTVEWLSNYIDHFLTELQHWDSESTNLSDKVVFEFDIELARSSLKGITENLGRMVDGVVVSFLSNDEYNFLWINNLLTEERTTDFDLMKYIVNFIEKKKIVQVLDTKIIKWGSVYYTFVQDDDNVLSIVYTKITVNDYDAIVAIVGPSRVDYKKNLTILKKLTSYLAK